MADTGSGAGSGAGGSSGLAVIVQAGGYDRVHYAFVLAAGAAATGRPATLFLTGRALTVLLPDPAWQGLDPADDGSPPALRDATLAERGVATLVELREACADLGVRLIACEMGWRALGYATPPPPAPGLVVETAGVVTLLSETPPGHHLIFV